MKRSERRFEGWTTAIRDYKTLPHDAVLCGHGLPGGKELYDEMQNYLAVAKVILAEASDGDDLKARLIRKFPDCDGIVLLDHQKRFLFKAPHR